MNLSRHLPEKNFGQSQVWLAWKSRHPGVIYFFNEAVEKKIEIQGLQTCHIILESNQENLFAISIITHKKKKQMELIKIRAA